VEEIDIQATWTLLVGSKNQNSGAIGLKPDKRHDTLGFNFL